MVVCHSVCFLGVFSKMDFGIKLCMPIHDIQCLFLPSLPYALAIVLTGVTLDQL